MHSVCLKKKKEQYSFNIHICQFKILKAIITSKTILSDLQKKIVFHGSLQVYLLITK